MANAVKDAPEASEAPEAKTAPGPGMDAMDMLDLMQSAISGALDPIRKEIADLQAKTVSQPRFVPMSPADNMPAAQKHRNLTGDGVAVGSYIAMDSRGHAVDPSRIWEVQRFETGMQVRINRDFAKPGFGWEMACLRKRHDHEDREVTWGDILDEFKGMRCTNQVPRVGGKTMQCRGVFDAGEACPMCGEGPKVVGIGVLQVDGPYAGQQAYNVRVPGLTNRPEGQVFFDCELIEA